MRKIAVIPVIGYLVLLLSNGAFGLADSTDNLKGSDDQAVAKDIRTASSERNSPLDKIKISGWGAMEFGQIMHGTYFSASLDHQWQEDFRSRLDLTSAVNDNLTINVGTEIWYQYSVLAVQTNGPSYLPGINIIMDEADMSYDFLNGDFPLSLQAGYFKFKYNEEATNLGEYLFRSGCYPTFVTNNFDFPMARLLGFNVENTILKDNSIFTAHHSLLLTSETAIYPYEDLSLSYIFSASFLKKAFTIGGGISGARMFSVNENNTTPHLANTISSITNVRNTVDANNNPITTGDTSYYTFAGTKLMGRFSFDPKPFIPLNIFGAEDLKLYGEVAVLGTKNYPIFKDSSIRYDLLSERTPMMVGFDFPTFKFLDVLSLEFEYFKNRYFDSYYNEVVGNGSRFPLPYTQARGNLPGVDSTSYDHDVKWSVYAKKTIGKNIQVIAQVAKDHRQATINLSDPRYGDYGDNLTTSKDWYYMIKLAYGF
jgi:hypothetical protein